MKKLMIAAGAIALAGVAVAATPAGDAYQFKMNLKTTKAALVDAKDGDCQNPLQAGCKVRIADTYSVVAWAWGCYVDCNDLSTFVTDSTKFKAWDTKHKVYFSKDATLNKDAVMTLPILQKIGKKFTDAEAQFAATWYADSLVETKAQKFTLMGAGFGKFNSSKQLYSSINGNVVGTMTAPWYDKTVQAYGYTCPSTGCTAGLPTTKDTVIYGTWSVKFNSSAAAKVNKGKLPATFPAY